MTWWLVAASVGAALPAGLRWLRVAQREHYLPGEVTRFSVRWWETTGSVNRTLWVFALFAILWSVTMYPWAALVVPVVAAIGPIGLSTKGTTSPLAWTPRLRRVAVVSGLMLALSFIVGGVLDEPWLVATSLFLLASIVDLALVILRPYEKHRGDEWVDKAAAKLAAVGPEVVAMTGSYGKTTTKNYLAHLLGGSRRVVASPASFNNRMGLARAINENLAPGTEVFIAEMGTYGYGEIAELCEWISPKVAAMISVGPVHLERFGTTRDIALAKSEILERAEVGVICVDYPELRRIADERREDLPIIEVSSAGGIHVAGERVIGLPRGVFAENLAVALGIVAALEIPLPEVLGRVADLPKTEHRQTKMTGAGGFIIIDDTFNSNPDGARSALHELVGATAGGRSAVVTPGMVEMGQRQEAENEDFARSAAALVDHFVVVGRTNREALLRGSANGKASVTVVGSREDAVEWVRENLGPGDAVLYENDLPDHYP
ncbi:MAG TPA: Mur ligase family protein [Acidimicrobiia bacterium]|nr:Mur ligase family protein [Acidimicrobiia bacterium]